MERIDYRKIVGIVLEASRFFFDEAALHHTIEKHYQDYATAVDIGVQKYVKEELQKIAPEVQFLGEEGEKSELDPDKPTWILDPVDGTNNLMFHMQISMISLAYAVGGKVQFGVVYNPFMKELFVAERGKGATMNGRPIHVNEIPDLAHAIVDFSPAPSVRDKSDEMFSCIRRVFDRCMDLRRLGTASLELCYVACGRLPAYFEYILHPWDYAAGLLVVEEAGGKVTTFDGGEVQLTGVSQIVATNGKVHGELLQAING